MNYYGKELQTNKKSLIMSNLSIAINKFIWQNTVMDSNISLFT